MSHQVHWSEKLVGEFTAKAMLSEDEIFVLVTRVKRWTVTKQAMELNVSEATVHRIIAGLKKKYDVVQKEYPEIFPVRRASPKEDYMDTH